MVSVTEGHEEVAAHQADCWCHLDEGDCEAELHKPEGVLLAYDSTGALWHIDPLCKVRPGRGVEPPAPGPVEE